MGVVPYESGMKDALFVGFYALDINEGEYELTEGSATNPDRPRRNLKATSQRRERAPLSRVQLVKSLDFIWAYFAHYLDNKSEAGK
jgi:hypothetical protein